MKIGDEVFVHGYVDEIRTGTIIIRNNGGYFGTTEDEVTKMGEERKGKWEFQTIIHGKRMWCSNCHSAFDLCCSQIKRYDETTKKDHMWAYCPWCGAMMENSTRRTKEAEE